MYRLRFISLIIKCLITTPVSLLAPRIMWFRALPLIDTDMTRVFTHGYSMFMAFARWELLFGSEFRSLAFKNRWAPITTAETVTYRRSILAFEKFQVTTKIVHWDDERFYVEHRFICKDRLCLRALVEGMIRSPDGVLKPEEMFVQTGNVGDKPQISEQLLTEVQALRSASESTKELSRN